MCRRWRGCRPQWWGGCRYVVVGKCKSGWWYVVAAGMIDDVLERGGWAPGSYFGQCGEPERVRYYEVGAPVLEEQEFVHEVVEDVPLALPGAGVVHVHVDGSCSESEGIGGAWVFGSGYYADRASLRLEATGSEMSELLGILGALMEIAARVHVSGCFVLRIDSVNAMEHVFEEREPTTPEGKDLLPGIRLARAVYAKLVGWGVQILHEKVSRKQNPAHHVAKAELKYRRGRGWRAADDRWPACMPAEFRRVFGVMAANRRRGGGSQGVPEECLRCVWNMSSWDAL